MRKLLLSSSVAVALGLAGCGGSETLEEVKAETPVEAPLSRVVFDPGAGNVNVPNDILMLPGDDGFFDYTLNIPVADATDFGDPQNALNVLDGWSTQHPFKIDINTAAGVSLDESSLAAGIHLYEATHGLDIRDPDCASAEIPSSGCKVGDKLTYGVDYVASLAGPSTVTVVPLKPLKPAQGYMLVVTDDLQDSEGNGVEGSTTWDLVKQDINTNPLSSESQLLIQQLVNSLIAPVVDAGMDRDSISYAAAFTTQSTSIALDTIKKVMVSEFAARKGAGDPTAGEALPAIVAGDAEAPTAMEALGLVNEQLVDGAVAQGVAGLTPEQQPLIPFIEDADFSSLQTCSGLLTASAGGFGNPVDGVNTFAAGVSEGILGQVGQFCAASHFAGEISLPYFLGVPSAENSLAPVNTFWQAACDSGVVLQQAPDDVLASATPGPNNELCQQLGLADLRVNGEKLDPARNITRFNPYPQPMGGNMGNETLDVQITVPNPMVAGALGFTIEEPEDGWPVVILSHGITSRKEAMLAISGTLSLAGIATVAIDHPLHGSRGYDLDGDGTDDLNATTVSATHYMNLGNLPTARDNLRQSASDFMGLRLGLNALVDTSEGQTIKFDMANVSVMGVSLGAMTVGNVSAVANTSMGGDLAALDSLYAVQQASLESPGGGVAQFLLESPSFGPLIKGLLLTESSPEFVAFVEAQYDTTDPSEAQLTEAVGLFLDNASDAQLATINATFAEFAFAAQSVLDAGDPNNYAKTLGETTPVHMMTVVGDGSEQNPPDQVIPVSTTLPLAGQLPYAGIVGLEQVTVTQTGDPVSGHVLFTSGAHASSLSPDADPAVTEEMQREVAGYIGSGATILPITNEDVVAN